MVDLIGDNCEPSDLVVPAKAVGKDQTGAVILSGAKLWVNVDGAAGWQVVTSS